MDFDVPLISTHFILYFLPKIENELNIVSNYIGNWFVLFYFFTN
jgi:hypothetical protein